MLYEVRCLNQLRTWSSHLLVSARIMSSVNLITAKKKHYTHLFLTIGKINRFRSSREKPNIGSLLSLWISSFCEGFCINGTVSAERFFEARNAAWISLRVLTPFSRSALHGRKFAILCFSSWSSTTLPASVSTKSILPGRKRPWNIERWWTTPYWSRILHWPELVT